MIEDKDLKHDKTKR